MTTCRPWLLLALTGMAFALTPAGGGADEPAKPSHRVLAADKGRVAIVNAKGEVEWEVPNKAEVHDIALLPNGNVLLPTSSPVRSWHLLPASRTATSPALARPLAPSWIPTITRSAPVAWVRFPPPATLSTIAAASTAWTDCWSPTPR